MGDGGIMVWGGGNGGAEGNVKLSRVFANSVARQKSVA